MPRCSCNINQCRHRLHTVYLLLRRVSVLLTTQPPPPPDIITKANVINEIARTLKPGGKAIIVDATQPEFDGAGVCTLDGLPSWGEMTPTYRAYLTSDLEYSLIKVGV